MSVNAIRYAIRQPIRYLGRLPSRLIERPKDRLGRLEVIMDDVDEVVGVHHLADELSTWCLLVVQPSPEHAEFEGFVLLVGFSISVEQV